MLDSRKIKQLAYSLGADLCGVACAERFERACAGLHPAEIDPDCRSVIVFARQFPASALSAAGCVPYSHIYRMMVQELDRLGLEFCLQLEEQGVHALPLPAEGPFERDGDGEEAHWGVLSLRHAGWLAGLGVLGRNTLLINRTYGSLIQLGALLVDLERDSDPIATHNGCPPGCRLCLDACPVSALDGTAVDGELCGQLTSCSANGGETLIRCNRCRQVCPVSLGI